MKHNEFLSKLEKEDIKPFYVFAGEEEYIKEVALSRVKKKIVQEGSEEFNYEILSGDEIVSSGIGSLINRCRVVPFFGQMRLVAVRHADKICKANVLEAENGVVASPGHIYIAPGGQHLELVRQGKIFGCKVFEGSPVSGHRPSVDVLFSSFAK